MIPGWTRDPRRFEEVERAVLGSLHEAASPALRARLGMRMETVGGAAVSIVAGIDSPLLNRVVGLGVDARATREVVDEVVGAYREAGVARHLVHVSSEARPEALDGWLEAAGYAPYRSWVPFAREGGGTAGASDPDPDLEVHPVGPEDVEPFGAIVADAFDLGSEGAPLVAALSDHPKWRTFLARVDGEPAAGVGVFLHQGAAWGDWAATRPAFRERGIQAALLAHAVRATAEMGCDVAFTETGEAVPGHSQHSWHNIERAGFVAGPPRANRIFGG